MNIHLVHARGVSITGNTFFLGHRYNLLAETVQRVREAAKAAGYEHNPLTGAVMSQLRRSRGQQFRGVLAALEISDEFKWEWVSIPHIYHTPFYVYAYAFGQLLVFSLYQQFKAKGESFKPKYLKILSSGGSEAPAKILAEADIDIRSAKFWQGGFDVIKEQVEELEKLQESRE